MVGCEARRTPLPAAPDAVLRLDMGGFLLTTLKEPVTDGTYARNSSCKPLDRSPTPLTSRSGQTIQPQQRTTSPSCPLSPTRTVEGAWIGLQATGQACWVLNRPSSYLAFPVRPSTVGPPVPTFMACTPSKTPKSSLIVGVDAMPMTVLEVQEERMPAPVQAGDSTVQNEQKQPLNRQTKADRHPHCGGRHGGVHVHPRLAGHRLLDQRVWRLASTAGLWLVGFIGRTKETNDGRFQRGRIMGYLQANQMPFPAHGRVGFVQWTNYPSPPGAP